MKETIKTINSDFASFNALGALAEKAAQIHLDSLEIDFSFCSFFEANMTAPFYAVITKYYEGLNKVSLLNFCPKVQESLQRNHFLFEFGYAFLSDSYQTNLPFKKFKRHAEEQFCEYIEQYIRIMHLPPMTDGLMKKFKQSLLELFSNAAAHSKSQQGIFICGQYYPREQRFKFTMADAGIGIPKNVSHHLGAEIEPCKAIEWALKEGNSTRENSPGGLGLSLLKDFIIQNQGRIQIVSGTGFYEFKDVKENFQSMNFPFPGVCVTIEINTSDTKSYCLKSDLKPSNIF